MEHDLFWSKLKPTVDRTLLFNIIQSSCLGEHSHRTVAMELVLERSIQERRKGVLAKAKDASQPDSTAQHQSSEVLAPQLRSPTNVPVLASQPPSHSTTSPVVASASAKTEVPQDPSTLSEPGKETKVAQRVGPATGSTNVPPSEHTVELACIICGAKVPRANAGRHFFCPGTSGWTARSFKCVDCGARRVGNADVCTGCRGKFV